MNEEEIMKNFAEAFEEKPKEPVIPYKASPNLNTEIGNPSINMSDPNTVNMNVNTNINDSMMIKDNVVGQPIVEQPTNNNNTQYINEPTINRLPDFNNNQNHNTESTEVTMPQDLVYNSNYQADVTEKSYDNIGPNVNYVSDSNYVSGKKKPATVKITIGVETKIVMFLVAILLVFVIFMPNISDFFRNIKLNILG